MVPRCHPLRAPFFEDYAMSEVKPVRITTKGGPFFVRPDRVVVLAQGPEVGQSVIGVEGAGSLLVAATPSDIAKAIGWDFGPDAPSSIKLVS